MSLRRDIRYSLRVSRSSPLLLSIATFSFGLGIFVSLSTFEIADLILFRPLAFRDSDRLAVLHRSTIRDGQSRSLRFPAEEVQQIEASEVVEATWLDEMGSFFLAADDGPTRIAYVQHVDPKIFKVLGVTPLLGPGLSLLEPAGPEMLLSHRLWKSHFGGSQDVIGLRLRGRNTTYTVVGVMPPQLRRLSLRAEAWVPRRLEAGSRRHLPIVLVRLKESLSIGQAEAALKMEHERFEGSLAGSAPPSNVFLEPLAEALADGELTNRQPARQRSLLLLGLGALILMLSCSNAGHAMVLLGAQRQREFAIRSSLGATRADLARQIVMEAALLIGTATALVGVFNTWLWSALVAWLPYSAPAQGERLPWLYQLPIWEVPELSSYGLLALLATTAIGLLTIGLWPAMRLLSRPFLAADLGSGGSVGMDRPGKRRLTQLFVSTQVALTFVVLLGAALLARSVQKLDQIPVGFDPGNILHVEMRFDDRVLMPPVKQIDREGSFLEVSPLRRAFLEQLVERTNRLPQVLGSAVTNSFENWDGFWLGLPDGETLRRASFEFVGEEYLKTLGVPLVRGRQFQPQDRDGNLPVAIVSQALAEQFWGQGDPLGKRLKVQVGAYPEDRWVTVVGVAANTRKKSFGSPLRQIVYLPDAQFPKKLQTIVASMASASLMVRTYGSPSEVSLEVRKIIASLSKDVALTSIEPLARTLNRRHSETYGFARILIGLGAAALFLALFGVFGIAAHSVRLRLPELAVRRALGAQASDVLLTVFRRNWAILILGLSAGAGLGLWLSRYLSGMLVGVSALDPASYLLAAMLIAATFLIAISIPVGRALRSRPSAILREV